MKSTLIYLSTISVLISFIFGSSDSHKFESKSSIKSLNGTSISSKEMDKFIETQMDSLNLPGLSIAFINDSKIVYHRALGIANMENGNKVNDQSLFDAASMSKTVFAFFVMKMVDKGMLNLDTPLYSYLPYPDIAYDDRYKLITARMVLSHTSGFPNWRFIDENGFYDPNRKLDIKFTPGTQFLYSGEGFRYLANVIAHLKDVDRNTLQSLLEKEVFEPIDMGKSSFIWNDYLEEHRVMGHLDNQTNPGWSVNSSNSDFMAAASLQTESKAYANFLIALINQVGLSKNSYDEMLKVHSHSPPNDYVDAQQWGLGIVVEPSEYGILYKHGGDNLSSTGEYLINIDKKMGYVFFTNCNKKDDFNERLLSFLHSSQ